MSSRPSHWQCGGSCPPGSGGSSEVGLRPPRFHHVRAVRPCSRALYYQCWTRTEGVDMTPPAFSRSAATFSRRSTTGHSPPGSCAGRRARTTPPSQGSHVVARALRHAASPNRRESAQPADGGQVLDAVLHKRRHPAVLHELIDGIRAEHSGVLPSQHVQRVQAPRDPVSPVLDVGDPQAGNRSKSLCATSTVAKSSIRRCFMSCATSEADWTADASGRSSLAGAPARPQVRAMSEATSVYPSSKPACVRHNDAGILDSGPERVECWIGRANVAPRG